MQCMKNNKAPGPDDLPADIWNLEGLWENVGTWLTNFFNTITDAGHAPSTWAMSIMVPIFKSKGDPAVCSKYPQFSSSHTP